jgi:hypothetical protein
VSESTAKTMSRPALYGAAIAVFIAGQVGLACGWWYGLGTLLGCWACFDQGCRHGS